MTLSVTFAGTGGGSVRSVDGTLACSSTCSSPVVPGGAVDLVPTAGPGSHFVGWSGACTGADHCHLAASAEAGVTATFDADSAYHPTAYLRVRRSGAGRITSDVPGIDCGYLCFTSFSSYGPVTLTAKPAGGFAFTGWGGACSGKDPCVVDMGSAARSVTAEFEALPPLPAACAEVTPRTIPAAVTIDLGGTPMEGTSDATGENFLFSVAPDGPGTVSRDYHFVRIRRGAATELAVRNVKYQNDASAYSVARRAESQPLGFEVFRSFNEDLVFDVYAPDGTLLRTGSATLPLQPGETSQTAEYAILPTGGIATVRWVWQGTSGYTIRYGRFDAQGTAQVADVPVDLGNSFLAAWDVDGDGNLLLVGGQGPGGYGDHLLRGRWLDSRGAPLTDWFSTGTQYVRNPFLLQMPSGLALGDDGYFSLVFPDAEATSKAAQAWLDERAEQYLRRVRGGFISFGARRDGAVPACGEGIELLTRTGVSCGCLTLPSAFESGTVQSVGRDGSLFAHRYLPAQSRSVFEVYPALFR